MSHCCIGLSPFIVLEFKLVMQVLAIIYWFSGYTASSSAKQLIVLMLEPFTNGSFVNGVSCTVILLLFLNYQSVFTGLISDIEYYYYLDYNEFVLDRGFKILI